MESTDKHPTYTIVNDAKDADACGWGFYSHDIDKMQKIYFKFPPLGDDELRIDITYAGLCYSEVHTIRGDWGPRKNHPQIPGHEIVGTVTKVGKNVTDFKLGDHVGFGCYRDFCGSCKKCQAGHDNFCSGDLAQKYTYGELFWGGYATACQHPAKLFFHLPKNIIEERAAPLFCAGVTLYNPIEKYCKKGQEVGVLGIGGIGHMGIKYAKKWGCTVTAFTNSKDKEQLCKDLGADRVVVASDAEAMKAEVGKYDVLLNTISNLNQQQFEQYFQLLGTQSTWVQLGGDMVKVSFTLGELVFQEKMLVGSQVGSKKVVQAMLDFSAANDVYPICEQFEFEDFPKAWNKLAHGRPHFRCVVKCKGAFK